MKNKPITLIIILFTIFSLISPVVVYADDITGELSTTNVKKMSKDEYTFVFTEIAKDVILKDSGATSVLKDCFVDSCQFNYTSYINSNVLLGDNIIYKNIEYVEAQNSSTGTDCVFVNLKVSYNSNNLCYLFKYTIDDNGKISKYEIYQY